MKKILSLLLITTVACSCNKPATDKAHSREMFDAGGLQVITSFANSKQQTMSVLYGNAAARTYAGTPNTVKVSGLICKLVVYKQADNKYWYGSHINGALLSVESITGETDHLIYKLNYGKAPTDSTGCLVAPATRIDYILSHGPSAFP